MSSLKSCTVFSLLLFFSFFLSKSSVISKYVCNGPFFLAMVAIRILWMTPVVYVLKIQDVFTTKKFKEFESFSIYRHSESYFLGIKNHKEPAFSRFVIYTLHRPSYIYVVFICTEKFIDLLWFDCLSQLSIHQLHSICL